MERGEVVRSPRLWRRRRMVQLERKRRRRRVTVTVALALVTGAAAWYLTTSSAFALSSIQVEGTRRLDDASIIAASGLREGANVFSTDLDAAAARIERLPGIRDATVARDGSLGVVITVVEREPALVAGDGETIWVLDRDGVILDSEAQSTGLVSVDLVRTPRIKDGALLDADLVRGLVRLADKVPGDVPATFVLQPDGELAFRWGDSDIRFGTLVSVGDKVRAIKLVRARVRSDGGRALVIDVSAPGRPAARVR